MLLQNAVRFPFILAGMTTTAKFRRIATEEAFSVRPVAEAIREVVRTLPAANLDLTLLRTIYNEPPAGSIGSELLRRLLDLEDERMRDMDANSVDMHLLSLTSPGVQMFDADTATELAAVSNDILRETIARHPSRFTGLASFAPHSPKRAAKEMERAINTLRLQGFIVNSHTNNEYLDDPKFWPILEAAEHLRRPLYIHPRAPSDGMADPFRAYGIDGAMWGYGIETGTHIVRLIVSGIFDRFPNLKIIIGHMGEAIPFWFWRLDFMHARAVASNRAKKIQLKPSEYFRRNFAITTSGMESPEALDYSIKVLGIENIMWAIDYPYQPTAPAVAFMDAFSIGSEQKALLYHGNAERIFGIEPQKSL
jgi:predicted TIM-barrel fold metal-dependent hydrolase